MSTFRARLTSKSVDLKRTLRAAFSSGTPTRFVHVVRCSDPNNSQNYCDVMVTDKLCVTGSNGQQFKLDMSAANAVPTINDTTGDGNGQDNGNNATRQTHIIRVTGDTDSSQFIDVEVLDKFCATGTNGQQWKGDLTSKDAVTFLAQINGGDLGDLISPEEKITETQSGATRIANVNEISNSSGQFMAVEEFEKICFTGPNGQQAKYDLSDQWEIIVDTTQYDDQGNPPPNTDRDPYIIFPSGTSGPFTGNVLVSQGPLWRVINASGGSSPFGPHHNKHHGPEDFLVIYTWQGGFFADTAGVVFTFSNFAVDSNPITEFGTFSVTPNAYGYAVSGVNWAESFNLLDIGALIASGHAGHTLTFTMTATGNWPHGIGAIFATLAGASSKYNFELLGSAGAPSPHFPIGLSITKDTHGHAAQWWAPLDSDPYPFPVDFQYEGDQALLLGRASIQWPMSTESTGYWEDIGGEGFYFVPPAIDGVDIAGVYLTTQFLSESVVFSFSTPVGIGPTGDGNSVTLSIVTATVGDQIPTSPGWQWTAHPPPEQTNSCLVSVDLTTFAVTISNATPAGV
jgi:hypothetical protein